MLQRYSCLNWEHYCRTIYFWFESWHLPSLYQLPSHVCIIGALRRSSLLFLQVLYKEGEMFVLNSHIVLYTYVCHQFFPLSSASLLISNVLFHPHFAECFLKVYYLYHSTWLEMTWVRYFDVMFLSHYDKMMTICLFRFCFHKLEVLTCAHLLSWWYSVGNVSILFSP